MKQEKKPYLLRQVYDKIYPDGARGSTQIFGYACPKISAKPLYYKGE